MSFISTKIDLFYNTNEVKPAFNLIYLSNLEGGTFEFP